MGPLLTFVIVVPAVVVVLALFLVMWRERTSDRTATVAVVAGIVLLGWLAGTCVLAALHFYAPPVSGPPAVGVQLVASLIGLGLALRWSASQRGLLTNRKNLIRLNVASRGRGLRGSDVRRPGPRAVGAARGTGRRRHWRYRLLGGRPFLVPLAVVLHVVSLWQLREGTWRRQ
jgi:hypothetical protein